MNILMVNKFLYPNGGAETYVFKLGECLTLLGHKVQYFGMEHKGRCVGNRVNAYTAQMDFHHGSMLSKITYPVRTIYSSQARRKIRLVLDDFKPDAVHLNNFNYQLTPSILLEIQKWKKQTGHKCRIVFTAHDYNLVCPNHLLRNPVTRQNCEKCVGGRFINCVMGRCIHGSVLKSIVGALEAYIWNAAGVYRHIDTVICCSEFIKRKIDSREVFRGKTVMIHNFVDTDLMENRAEENTGIKKGTVETGNSFGNIGKMRRNSFGETAEMKNGCADPSVNESGSGDYAEAENSSVDLKRYVLYFGRFSQEKGIDTLIRVCREMSDIPFVFAGRGPLENRLSGIPNIYNVGFQKGDSLRRLICGAEFTVCPSEWYENCPISILESQMLRTPVLGADIGGIPELIEDGVNGELFQSGSRSELKDKIRKLWEAKDRIDVYRRNSRNICVKTAGEYAERILMFYQGMTVKDQKVRNENSRCAY